MSSEKILNVTQRTLNNYINKGILHPIKINAHHYEYDEKEIFDLLNGGKTTRINVIYARVSLYKQKDDLQRQIQRLNDFASHMGLCIDKQMSDIKSGMNFNERKSFNELLKMVTNHEVHTVIIEHKDRLVRFGFELIEEIFKLHGTEIIVMTNVEDDKTYEQELTDDLISIIHYYSLKSYSNRRKLNKAKHILEDNNLE